MTLRAFGNRLIVIPDALETQHENGLYIPETAQKGSKQGKVFSVSLLVEEQHDIHEGDTVLWDHQYAGATVSYEGQEYLILEVEEIFGVV